MGGWMTQHVTHMERLVDLAKEKSSEKRCELLRDITVVFTTEADHLSDELIDQFGSVMGAVSANLDQEIRARLSDSICEVARAPHALIKQLAHDEAEVASPVLAKSPVLSESDLVEIAESKGQSHLMAMTKRLHIPQAVSDIIVDRGNDDVLINLCSNEGAKLSRQSLEALVEKSENIVKLQGPMARRRDVPIDLLQEMYFFVSSAVRQIIVETSENLDPEALAQSSAQMTQKIIHDELLLEGAIEYVDRLEKYKELTERRLVILLKEKRFNEFLIGFSRLTGIDFKIARRLVFEKSCDGFAIACRAAEFDQSSFAEFISLTNERTSRDVNIARKLIQVYNKVPIETAQRTLRFWRVRQQTAKTAA